MTWQAVIPVDRCRDGLGTFVEHAGRELAVYLLDDARRVEVIDNTCPHAGGNLSAGRVRGAVVTCPSHQWAFDLTTGVCTHSDRARVRRYPAEVRDNVVWVDLP
jgi:nitrite reductase/ring-hydroxylating ferredoxin subunit